MPDRYPIEKSHVPEGYFFYKKSYNVVIHEQGGLVPAGGNPRMLESLLNTESRVGQ